ncbi:heme-binding protein 2-like [Tubulanus polymorphus]|uniref:heme-binding protein 2-like n=1 Tax=Tubulanus polymorphus TaxID=672921 RepID=UPI003DA3A67F
MNYLKATGSGLLVATGLKKTASPKFDVIESFNDYEEREYPTTRWISCTVTSKKYSDALSDGFWKCYRYIQGKNDQEKSFEVTLPVISVVDRQETETEVDDTFTTSFYLDESAIEEGKGIPRPTEEGVYIEEKPSMKLLVRKFTGFTGKEATWIAESKKLLVSSLDKGYVLAEHPPVFVHYDPPFKPMNKRSEVWLILKPDTPVIVEDLQENGEEQPLAQEEQPQAQEEI